MPSKSSKKKKSKKKKEKIRYYKHPEVDDLSYRIRWGKKGIKWHSWVDPDRPDSPPVEWPEYPDSEIKDNLMDERYKKPDEVDDMIKKLFGEEGKPDCGPGPATMNTPVDNLDLEPDDILDSVQLPQYPGMTQAWNPDGSFVGSGGDLNRPTRKVDFYDNSTGGMDI